MKRFVLGITGASGSVIGLRVLRELVRSAEVLMTLSTQSFSIITHETGLDFSGESADAVQEKLRGYAASDRLHYYGEFDFTAPIASGSFPSDGMCIVPCSMKTLAGIANGHSTSLVERAADVVIKEGRRLVLSPREMPFSAIHLENMLKLARLGVRIAPPVAAFYHGPSTVDDLVDFMAGKILDAMGVDNDLYRRWEGRYTV